MPAQIYMVDCLGGQMHYMKNLFTVTALFLTISCAILKDPIIKKSKPIDNFQFAILPTTSSKVSTTGAIYGNQMGVYGSTSTREVNPGSLIEGFLLKRGIVILNEIQPEHKAKTLMVRYGESGKRNVAGGFGGYTLEVTILFISAQTNEPVYSCTAEGQGSTEADDIRVAVERCLSGFN
jgi:hypothetical protein